MTNKNLLPSGFRDDLFPLAEQEHLYKNKIISIFSVNGYSLVKPPLIEFLKKEDQNVFIFINENEKQKLKIRNDITMQVARIASSRLKKNTRPLKLCYYGEVVRNTGTILRPEREFLQIGAECIGEKNYLADVEILMLAFQSLEAVGIKEISIDFSNPIFLNVILNSNLINGNKKKDFIKYFRRKDIKKSLSFLKNDSQNTFVKNLIECRGDIKDKQKVLDSLRIDNNTNLEVENLLKVYKLIKSKCKNVKFNIDFTENRFHTYYSGLNFTIFAKNVRGEIASGGRYLTSYTNGEDSTGFTCYMDSILRASSHVIKQKRIMIPFNTSNIKIKKLIKNNFVIEKHFNKSMSLLKIAQKKNCTHILLNNKIKKINYA